MIPPFKKCHDNVGKFIHWKLCKKYNTQKEDGMNTQRKEYLKVLI